MATPPPPSKEPIHLISLGSSFAAGPGILPYALKSAGRSSKNYASLLSSHFKYTHTDLSVSGATLPNILSVEQIFFGTPFPPQLQGVTADADIVTITAGGNDLGYIGGLIKDGLASSWWGWLLGWLIPEREKVGKEEVVERFIATLDAVHKKAPNAKIFLVEYLTLLGPNIRPGKDVTLSVQKVKHHQDVAETLHQAYVLAADARGSWVELVDVAERSKEHGLGSQEPWVEGLSWGTLWRKNAFHPNEKGMRAVADMLIEKLEGAGAIS